MRNPKRCKGLELLEFWQTTKKGWKTKRDQVGTEASSGLSWNPGQVNIGNILKALQNFPMHDKNLSKPGLQQSEGLLNVPFQPLGLSRGKVARLSPLNQMWLLRGAAASALGETIKFKQFKMKHPMLDLRVAQVGSADDSKWPQIFFLIVFWVIPGLLCDWNPAEHDLDLEPRLVSPACWKIKNWQEAEPKPGVASRVDCGAGFHHEPAKTQPETPQPSWSNSSSGNATPEMLLKHRAFLAQGQVSSPKNPLLIFSLFPPFLIRSK